MSNYVYVIVNKINLKLYFGSHSWDGEGLDPNYYGSGTAITRAVRKYGKDNFIVYPIKFYNTVEECRQAEEQLLNKYNIADNPYCYNIKNAAVGWTSEDMTGEKHPNYGKRGKDTSMYGKHHTEETKRKISQAHKGKTLSEEHKQKISQANKGENNPMYGKHPTLSEEHRKKLSQAKKGKTLSEEHRKKLSQAKKGENNPMYGRTGEKNPFYGKTHTEETRQKLSQAMTGEKHPFYGKTHTEETKQKMSQSKNYRKIPVVAIKDGKVKIFESQNECARQLNLNQSHISQCLNGRCKTCKGYVIKYLEQLESGIYEGITEIKKGITE